MSKITTKAYCNILDAGTMNSGPFLGDLINCPTYQEINEIGKFNINNTYENNQLVKESDISKYNGKIKNHTIIWGEWDLTKTWNQQSNSVNVRLKQNFLKAPDTNLSIKVKFKINYKQSSSDIYLTSTYKEVTVNFNQTTNNDKNFAYSQDFNLTFGNSSSIFNNMEINNVSITPSNSSIYNYITSIKNITQNYFINNLSISKTEFYIDSYTDDTTNNTITNVCRISPTFTIPTGDSINNINIYINDEYNYSTCFSVANGLSYYPSYNLMSYTFKAVDYYGERGYKLPYFYTKFTIEDGKTYNKSYAYALWEPNTSQTGIELTSIIDESEPINEN